MSRSEPAERADLGPEASDSPVTTAELGDLQADFADPGDLGLPVRVRQASLAPQLRDTTRRDDSPLPSEPRQASPEAARNTMAAMQRGWERGRAGSTDSPDDTGGSSTPDESGQ